VDFQLLTRGLVWVRFGTAIPLVNAGIYTLLTEQLVGNFIFVDEHDRDTR
jgi:hypothetical protein